MRLLTHWCLLLLSALLAWGSEPYPPRLRRPDRLDTPEQVNNYLKELQDYYSVHGRGRYGKRQMRIADSSVVYRETPFDNLHDDPLWKHFIKK